MERMAVKISEMASAGSSKQGNILHVRPNGKVSIVSHAGFFSEKTNVRPGTNVFQFAPIVLRVNEPLVTNFLHQKKRKPNDGELGELKLRDGSFLVAVRGTDKERESYAGESAGEERGHEGDIWHSAVLDPLCEKFRERLSEQKVNSSLSALQVFVARAVLENKKQSLPGWQKAR